MPCRGVALLLSVPLLFQPGFGADAQSCVEDDSVCFLQHKPMGTMLDKNDKYLPNDDPLVACRAQGAKMWVHKGAIEQFVHQIMARSVKDIPDTLADQSGQSGETYFGITNIKMKVSFGGTKVALRPPHEIAVDTTDFKVHVEADYQIFQEIGQPPKETGKVSGTSNSQSSLNAVLSVGVSKDGTLALSMGSTFDLSFDEFTLDGERALEYVTKSVREDIRDVIKGEAHENLKLHLNLFVQNDLTFLLADLDMRIPIEMGPPLDGFFLNVPICDIAVDKDFFTLSLEGVVSHPHADGLVFNAPMDTSLFHQLAFQNQNVQVEITEWTLNGALWLAYRMGRFNLNPSEILGRHRERTLMRPFGLERSAGKAVVGDPSRGAGFLDLSSKFKAYEAPTATMVCDGTVQFSFPMDCDYYFTPWKAPMKYMSVRSTVVLKMKVQTPNSQGSPVQGTVSVVSISKPDVRFTKKEYHFDAVDNFFHHWVNRIYIPIFNMFHTRLVEFNHMDNLSDVTTFNNSMVDTGWGLMLLSADVHVSPFIFKKPVLWKKP